MRPNLFVLITACALTVAIPRDQAWSASATPASATDGASVIVRLAALMAPVRRPDGRIESAPVTPLLELGTQATVRSVCGMTPVIRDAVITTLYESPIPGSDGGTLDLRNVTERLTQAVNAALGRALVKGVDLLPGVHQSTLGARFANAIRCERVMRKKQGE